MWKIVEEAGFAELWPQLAEEHEDGTFFPRDPGTAFFSGLEESSFVNEVVESLERFPTRGLREEATGDAWRRLPVTYVKTQRDITLPVTAQEAMLGRVRGEGVVVRVEEFDTHHSPWVSMPEEVVRVAVEVASDARNPE
jgi:hypothetical protein